MKNIYRGRKIRSHFLCCDKWNDSGTRVYFSLVKQTDALLVATLFPQYGDDDGICNSHVFNETFWKIGHDDHDVTTVSIIVSKLSKNVSFFIGSKKTFWGATC